MWQRHRLGETGRVHGLREGKEGLSLHILAWAWLAAVLQQINSSGKIEPKDEMEKMKTAQTLFKWRHARGRNYFALRSVVPPLCTQLPRPGGA